MDQSRAQISPYSIFGYEFEKTVMYNGTPYDDLSEHMTSMQNYDNDTCMIQVRGCVLAVSCLSLNCI